VANPPGEKFGKAWLFGRWEAEYLDGSRTELFFQRDGLYDYEVKPQPGGAVHSSSGTWGLERDTLTLRVRFSSDLTVPVNTTHAFTILAQTADGFILRNWATDVQVVYKRKY
jgi:hypothetical protein